jgi:hypothetical protein
MAKLGNLQNWHLQIGGGTAGTAAAEQQQQQ